MAQWFRVKKKLSDVLTGDEVQEQLSGIKIEIPPKTVTGETQTGALSVGKAIQLAGDGMTLG